MADSNTRRVEVRYKIVNSVPVLFTLLYLPFLLLSQILFCFFSPFLFHRVSLASPFILSILYSM